MSIKKPREVLAQQVENALRQEPLIRTMRNDGKLARPRATADALILAVKREGQTLYEVEVREPEWWEPVTNDRARELASRLLHQLR